MINEIENYLKGDYDGAWEKIKYLEIEQNINRLLLDNLKDHISKKILYNLNTIVNKLNDYYLFTGFEYSNYLEYFGNSPFKLSLEKKQLLDFEMEFSNQGKFSLLFECLYSVIYNIDFVGKFKSWDADFYLDEMFFFPYLV